MSVSSSLEEKRKWSLSYIADTEKDSDDVEVLTFYHAKTPALPAGRMVQIVGTTVLIDTPLPYKKPYLFSIKAMDAFQTAFGHSPAMDLMPLQEALDSCFSTALSNINSFALGLLVTEKNSVTFDETNKGLTHVEVNRGASDPKVLNLLQIPAEIFNFSQMLIQNQETISGVNSVARGNVPHQMSGTAMALVAQQALTFSSGLQASYNSLTENVFSALIELLQTYAVVPRIAQISGKSKKSYMQSFKSEDLKGISRVVVESSNAFTKTTAGKVEVANTLLQSGLIDTPEQYIQVVTTGTLEPLVEHDQAQLMLIRQENEFLAAGKPVQALMTDEDSLHALEHSVVLSDPEVRNDLTILNAALAHIQEHINNAKTKDPMLAMMLKQQPLAQPMPQGNVNPGTIGQAPPMDLQSAPTPGMPKNPMTGQDFDPTGVQ